MPLNEWRRAERAHLALRTHEILQRSIVSRLMYGSRVRAITRPIALPLRTPALTMQRPAYAATAIMSSMSSLRNGLHWSLVVDARARSGTQRVAAGCTPAIVRRVVVFDDASQGRPWQLTHDVAACAPVSSDLPARAMLPGGT